MNFGNVAQRWEPSQWFQWQIALQRDCSIDGDAQLGHDLYPGQMRLPIRMQATNFVDTCWAIVEMSKRKVNFKALEASLDIGHAHALLSGPLEAEAFVPTWRTVVHLIVSFVGICSNQIVVLDTKKNEIWFSLELNLSSPLVQENEWTTHELTVNSNSRQRPKTDFLPKIQTITAVQSGTRWSEVGQFTMTKNQKTLIGFFLLFPYLLSLKLW